MKIKDEINITNRKLMINESVHPRYPIEVREKFTGELRYLKYLLGTILYNLDS